MRSFLIIIQNDSRLIPLQKHPIINIPVLLVAAAHHLHVDHAQRAARANGGPRARRQPGRAGNHSRP